MPIADFRQDYTRLLNYLRGVATVQLEAVQQLSVEEGAAELLLLASLRDQGAGSQEVLDSHLIAELAKTDGSEIYATLQRFHRRVNTPELRTELRLGIGLVQGKPKKKVVRYPLVSYPVVIGRQRDGALRVMAEAGQEWLLSTAIARKKYVGIGEQEARTLEADLRAVAEIDGFDEQLRAVPGLLKALLGSRWKEDHAPPLGEGELTISAAPLLYLHTDRSNNYSAFIDRMLDNPIVRAPLFHGLLRLPMEDLEHPIGQLRLPLAANAEQEKIGQALRSIRALQVQGPPGTGKSHAIANLLPPLLAEGKRVLVLTEKQIALEAILDKIPAPLRSFLLELREDRRALSVRRLTEARFNADAARLARQHSTHLVNLERLEEERTERLREWSSWVSGVCLKLTPGYQGTVRELTEQLQTDAAKFSWHKDEVTPTQIWEGGDGAQVPAFNKWHRSYSDLRRGDYQHGTSLAIDVGRLPTPDQLREYAKVSRQLFDQFPPVVFPPDEDEVDGRQRQPPLVRDHRVRPEQLDAAVAAYVLFRAAVPAVDWCQHLVPRLGGQRADVEALVRTTEERLTILEQAQVEELLTNYGCPASDEQLRATLIELSQPGNWWEQWFSTPSWIKSTPVVKELPPALARVLEVRRGFPEEAAVPRILDRFVQLRTELAYLDGLWPEQPDGAVGDRDRLRQHRSRLRLLRQLLEAEDAYRPAALVLSTWLDIPLAEVFTEGQLPILQAAQDHRRLSVRQEELEQVVAIGVEELRRHDQLEPLVINLERALKRKEVGRYLDYYEAAAEGWKRRQQFLEMRQLEEELTGAYGRTIDHLKKSAPVAVLSEAAIAAADQFQLARARLLAHLMEYEQEGLGHFAQLDEQLQKRTQQLLAVQITQQLQGEIAQPAEYQQDLTDWLRYSRQRTRKSEAREAREALTRVLPLVPCLVGTMKLLTELVQPEARMFDVIIVDEASMLSSAALCLLYLTEQIVVIGDNEQIAPLFVGTKKHKFAQLVEKHLEGIPVGRQLVGNESLFQLITTLPYRTITLREHFRCMPEIIAYSNAISYAPIGQPLLPLRQVTSDRKPPLKLVRVSGAVHELQQGTPTNQAEAEAIVKLVVEIIRVNAKEELTIGIITLLGHRQHVIINRLLEAQIPATELERRQLFAGQPPDFQGSERDIVLLSLVTAPGHNASSSDADLYRARFNVAASRAKDQLIVFCSQPPGALRGRLQNALVAHCEEWVPAVPLAANVIPANDYERAPPEPFTSWFHVDVARTLQARRYPLYLGQEVGGLPLDLVVGRRDGSRVVIICPDVGTLDAEEWEELLQRYLVLIRAGWEVRVVNPYLEQLQTGLALEALKRELGPAAVVT